MNPRELIAFLDRQPFAPFDVRTSDGRIYRVDHPEFAMRSREGGLLFLQTNDDRNIRIAIEQIAAIEDVNTHATPNLRPA